jgi:hypothetical protein
VRRKDERMWKEGNTDWKDMERRKEGRKDEKEG